MDFSVMSGTGLLLGLVFLVAGVIDAVCGGGGLLTLPALAAAGLPMHLVSGSNQCAAFAGNGLALGRYVRQGKVHWRTALPAGAASLVGAHLGARLNLFLPETVLQGVMLVLIPVVAAVTFTHKGEPQNRVESLSAAQQLAVAVGIGLVLGAYQGFYGAGGGTFYLLAFTYLGRLDMVTASGNAKVCGVFAGLAASVTYALSGNVLWGLVLLASLFHLVGSYLGVGLAVRKGARVIRPMFLVVLGLLFVRLAGALLA